MARRDAQAEYDLRPATPADVVAVTDLVNAAYGHYVERIGGLPGPMLADYRRVLTDRRVTVGVTHGTVAGVLVIDITSDGLVVENVAVHPSEQGRGLGRALLTLAEGDARDAGLDSVSLYTHELMTENLALYRRNGYVEYERRPVEGGSLIFLRKQLVLEPS